MCALPNTTALQWVFIYVYCTLKGKEPACKKTRDKILASFPQPPPGMFVPQCREDGGYQDSQCHGSTGFCWCVDEYGNELTGTRVRGTLNCSGAFMYYLYILILNRGYVYSTRVREELTCIFES